MIIILPLQVPLGDDGKFSKHWHVLYVAAAPFPFVFSSGSWHIAPSTHSSSFVQICPAPRNKKGYVSEENRNTIVILIIR